MWPFHFLHSASHIQYLAARFPHPSSIISFSPFGCKRNLIQRTIKNIFPTKPKIRPTNFLQESDTYHKRNRYPTKWNSLPTRSPQYPQRVSVRAAENRYRTKCNSLPTNFPQNPQAIDTPHERNSISHKVRFVSSTMLDYSWNSDNASRLWEVVLVDLLRERIVFCRKTNFTSWDSDLRLWAPFYILWGKCSFCLKLDFCSVYIIWKI